MASRPFASVNVALETDEEPPDLIGGSIKVRSGSKVHTSAFQNSGLSLAPQRASAPTHYSCYPLSLAVG